MDGSKDASTVSAAQASGGAEEVNSSTATPAQNEAAAQTIQRNYRGYRARRELDGMGISATAKWVEVIKEAQDRNVLRPRPRREISEMSETGSFAQGGWKQLRTVARRAHNDDTSDTEGEEGMTPEQLEAYRSKKAAQKKEREENSKMMGLEYFLEMVDQKHRYGSHLRAYHAVWKQSDTNDNFFYWLDQGEGKDVEVPTCSREKLERDQVRYLTREERQNYLIKIDKKGLLYYAKNGNHVTTSKEFKDSIKGIVPKDDPTPAFREDTRYPDPKMNRAPSPAGSAESDEDDVSSLSSDASGTKDGEPYANQDLEQAKGIKKVQYVSAAAVLNHMLQKTTKKNTWIFVADTSFRLYIGIKQSGAFQHSSFLHGARISAAGLIKVKNGQLRQLSPLSGHYRPPTSIFRAFVRSLKESGVDMSRVSISRSYAVLLGLEGYMGAKKRAKAGKQGVGEQVERVFKPEEAKKRREMREDKSESARREKEHLEEQKRKEAMLKRENSWGARLTRRFRTNSGDGSDAAAPPTPPLPPPPPTQ